MSDGSLLSMRAVANEHGPRISVAIPTHRRAGFLGRTLRSVVDQTCPAGEIIVSEDGTDPETADVVARFVAEGAPIRHHRNDPPLGMWGNRRRALGLTTGELVAMLDDDDLWLPGFLETTSSALAQHPGCGFAMTDHWLVDERGDVLRRESDEAARRFGRAGLPSGVYHDVLARHLVTKTMTLVTSLFRREALEAVGFMPEGGHVAPEYALFLQLGARRVSVAYTAERLGAYRVHSGQSIPADRIAHGETVLSILRTLADGHSLDTLERERLGEVFRSTTIELAINHSRAGHRRAAFRVLRGYRDFGHGVPDPRRLAVLGCFLAGAGPVALRTRRALRSRGQRRATTES